VIILVVVLVLVVLVAVLRSRGPSEEPDLAFYGRDEDGELVIGWCDEDGRLYTSWSPGELEELERKVGRSLRSPLSEPRERTFDKILGWPLSPVDRLGEPAFRPGYEKVNGEWFRLPFRIEGCPGAMVEVDADGKVVDIVSHSSTRQIRRLPT
jgi:hypothetical protein